METMSMERALVIGISVYVGKDFLGFLWGSYMRKRSANVDGMGYLERRENGNGNAGVGNGVQVTPEIQKSLQTLIESTREMTQAVKTSTDYSKENTKATNQMVGSVQTLVQAFIARG